MSSPSTTTSATSAISGSTGSSTGGSTAPSDDELLGELAKLKYLSPRLGVQRVASEVHERRPSWKFNARRVRSLLKQNGLVSVGGPGSSSGGSSGSSSGSSPACVTLGFLRGRGSSGAVSSSSCSDTDDEDQSLQLVVAAAAAVFQRLHPGAPLPHPDDDDDDEKDNGDNFEFGFDFGKDDAVGGGGGGGGEEDNQEDDEQFALEEDYLQVDHQGADSAPTWRGLGGGQKNKNAATAPAAATGGASEMGEDWVLVQ